MENFGPGTSDIVGGHYWHTTESYNAGDTARIRALLEYIAASECVSLVAVQTDVINGDLEHARRECLAGLLAALSQAGVRLVVLERRRTQAERNADSALIRRLVVSQRAGRVEAVQATPSAEELLWAPDVVGWAMRRDLATGDPVWFDTVESCVQVVHACDGFRLNAKRPDHAAAVDSGPDESTVLADRGKRRSSRSSVPLKRDPSQRLSAFLSELSHATSRETYAATRAWILEEFPP